MLTRLKVSGFKNLYDIDVRFGGFTCIAGANGVGKSNLFDAIKFLSDLADRPLIDAAMSVRDESSRAADVRSLFQKYRNIDSKNVSYAEEMTFEAEMVIPNKGYDDFGQQAIASATLLKYTLKLAYRKDETLASLGRLEVLHESLERVKGLENKNYLISATSKEWYKSTVHGGKTVPLISTEVEGDNIVVRLHQDAKQGGSYVRRIAKTLPRTVLSSTNAAESPTALLVRNEMRSWRLLQLEPSSLRQPDNFTSPTRLGEDGSHLAATLYHLAQTESLKNASPIDIKEKQSRIYGQVAKRVTELIEDVLSVSVDRDEQRQTLTLQVTDKTKTSYPARALSDGTLRFLALAVLELDPQAQGVLCLEEPENGIHPARVPAIVKLLQDIAVDVNEPVDLDNPLRQVIINTHSPTVVAQVPDDSLLVAELTEKGVFFSCLPETWREVTPNIRIVPKGKLLAYLNPNRPSVDFENLRYEKKQQKHNRRVIDHPDLQPFLLHFGD